MNYVPNTDYDRAVMLEAVGVSSVADLFDVIPARMRSPQLALPSPMDELAITKHMQTLARRNANIQDYACFLGGGAYNHFVPAAVRHVTGRSEFFTAYTPYQPEISQGTLQAIFEYQTVVCQLTGMDAANASLYDASTATVEAVTLAQRVTGRRKVVVASSLNPEYLRVLKTYTLGSRSTLVSAGDRIGWTSAGKVDIEAAATLLDVDTACLVIQHPNFYGVLEDVEQLAVIAHAVGALFVVVVDPISLGLLKPPGAYDADVAVGEGQSLGHPLSFGGPYLGMFSVRERYVRHMPGRIVGQTNDANGQRGFVLTLQTREQHIRRERAISNICSNEALNALAALTYVALLGKQGIRSVAERSAHMAHYAASKITAVPGFSRAHSAPFFKEFVVRCPLSPDRINALLVEHHVIGGLPLGNNHPELQNCMLWCCTEMNTQQEVETLVSLLARVVEQQ